MIIIFSKVDIWNADGEILFRGVGRVVLWTVLYRVKVCRFFL